jgi:DNA repair protein RecO (recombination protein O)
LSSERSEALVLRSVDYSETSKIVTFLCPIRGRLACMCAGARRAKGSLAGALDTFNRVEAVYYWKDGRNIQRLAEATLLDGHFGIKADLDKSLYAAIPLELVYKVAHENEPSQGLYELICEGLKDFDSWEGDARAHCCWQVLRLLSCSGFEMNLVELVNDGNAVAFSYRSGIAADGEHRDKRLGRVAFETLRELAIARDACPNVKVPAEVFETVCRYTEHQLESSFKSIRVLQDVTRVAHKK